MASSSSFTGIELPDNAAQQDVTQLESIYTNRRHDILRLLLHSGVNFSEAEDVTQQVFANAYERPASALPEGSLFSWLVKCARNLAINRYHRQQREVLAPAKRWQEWKDTIVDPAKSILAQLEEQQEYEIVSRAFAQLNLRQQQCILLHGQGYTFDEIAAALDIPRSNAIYAVGAAIMKLRKALKVSKTSSRA